MKRTLFFLIISCCSVYSAGQTPKTRILEEPFFFVFSNMLKSEVNVLLRFNKKEIDTGFVKKIIKITWWKNEHLVESDEAMVVFDVKSVGKKPVDFILRKELEAGYYVIKVKLENEEVVKGVFVENYKVNRIQLSDIVLTDGVYKAGEKNKISRNVYSIYPKNDDYYELNENKIIVYAEIYNLDMDSLSATSDSLYIRSYLSRNGKIINETEGFRRIKRKENNIPFLQVFDNASLISGKYEFHIEVLMNLENILVKKEKKIYVYNQISNLKENELSDPGGDVEKTNDFDEVNYFKLIMSPLEREVFDDLNSDKDKKKFLDDFWRKKGGQVSRKMFINEVQEVNIMFSTKWRKGFETDRGRVYLKYGKPNTIDKFDDNSDSYPYQIWIYDNLDGLGTMIFVFVDKMSTGIYDIVHSTVTGEIHNPNWQQFIRRDR
jgi:GWxTD domain-containing protein